MKKNTNNDATTRLDYKTLCAFLVPICLAFFTIIVTLFSRIQDKNQALLELKGETERLRYLKDAEVEASKSLLANKQLEQKREFEHVDIDHASEVEKMRSAYEFKIRILENRLVNVENAIVLPSEKGRNREEDKKASDEITSKKLESQPFHDASSPAILSKEKEPVSLTPSMPTEN